MKLLKNEKVRHIKDGDATISYLRNIEKAYKEDRLTDFISIARYNDKTLEYNWFGSESCIMHLGLLERMKSIINDWIVEENS